MLFLIVIIILVVCICVGLSNEAKISNARYEDFYENGKRLTAKECFPFVKNSRRQKVSGVFVFYNTSNDNYIIDATDDINSDVYEGLRSLNKQQMDSVLVSIHKLANSDCNKLSELKQTIEERYK